jgi:mannose-6-phosphate isomerase
LGRRKLKTLLINLVHLKLEKAGSYLVLKVDISVVANGVLKGKSLLDIIDDFLQKYWVPLFIRTLESNSPYCLNILMHGKTCLSSTHPNDELARKRHNSLEKTEMWYVMQEADPDSRIIVGFKRFKPFRLLSTYC